MFYSDRATAERVIRAIENAQIDMGLAATFDDMVDAAFEHLGPYSDLAILRREAARSLERESV